MKENVLIFVAEDAETKEKILSTLFDVLDDFLPTCGRVASVFSKSYGSMEIWASYVQDEHWKGFLTGIAYFVDKKLKEEKNASSN